jgi:hypothetical protein
MRRRRDGWMRVNGALLGAALGLATAAGAGLGQQATESPPSAELRAPSRVFADNPFAIDAILTRPYSPDVPLGSVGERLWASSPQGWAFGDDVHWLYLTNLRALDLEVRDEAGPLQPAKATYFPSHVHMEGATRAVLASASFTHARDKVGHPLTRPFDPKKRWTAWSSGRREDWYALDFGAPRALQGIKVWFFDDEETNGGCRPPERVTVETWDGQAWKPIANVRRQTARPVAGENLLRFDPINTERLRLVFRHAGENYYTGLYGIEPVAADGSDANGPPVPFQIAADKWIAPDDILVSVVRVTNAASEPRRIRVVPAVDWRGQYTGKVISNRQPEHPEAASGPWVFTAEGRARLHGFDVRQSLRYAVASDPPVVQDVFESRNITVAVSEGRDDNTAFLRQTFGFEHELAPGETRVFKAALEIKRPDEPSTLDRVLIPARNPAPSLEAGTKRIGTINVERQDTRDILADQARLYQAWFDDNLAAFECSDELIQKMYYHRAYVLRKNMLDPRLGALKWPTQAEGRWRSTWYPNVISYGAAHQVREARWLADPRYWTGHLRTWAHNQKADHVYPSHVTPAGPSDGQYTDWITSTAWDGHLVHPDAALLGELADALAENVRGWQRVYDPDGDGLLMVDSHWWTGMEYQPSFFYFGDYQTSADFHAPAKPVNLERVDLTAYNFGNAVAVSRIYKALNQAEKAREFDELAEKIRKAVAEKMWRKEGGFFYSLRADDDAVADVKEIIGVYPFYFGMFAPGSGHEAAWTSILDPEQFWTPWPVASASKQCPAYSQTGWPQADGRSVACMWNGPTWPHANSIVLTAMARTLRADRDLPKESASPLTREKLWELFSSFTKAQYRDQDPTFPWTGEFYNGETGAWKTAERDYNHSTWLDILIPDLIGLVPRDDEILEIDPLLPPGALSHFTLDGQRYRGRDVTIVWDAPGDNDDRHGDGREAFDVYLDGQLAATAPEPKRLLIDLRTGKALEDRAAPAARGAGAQPKAGR